MFRQRKCAPVTARYATWIIIFHGDFKIYNLSELVIISIILYKTLKYGIIHIKTKILSSITTVTNKRSPFPQQLLTTWTSLLSTIIQKIQKKNCLECVTTRMRGRCTFLKGMTSSCCRNWREDLILIKIFMHSNGVLMN